MIFATPSLYDQVEGGATQLPFVIKFRTMPQWKKMAERSRHSDSFLNQNPQVGTYRMNIVSFFGRRATHNIRRGQWSCHIGPQKESHVLFNL